MPSRRSLWIGFVIFIVVLITAPVLWGAWNSWRLDKVGVTTTAEVTQTQALPAPPAEPTRFFLAYRLPADADPQRHPYTAEVDRATYTEAVETREIAATYLEDKPRANRIAGQVTNRLVLWLALVADATLLGILALALKFGERREKQIVLLATADVVRSKPGFAVEENSAEVVVRGDIVTITPGEITVNVGRERDVRVVLGEYANPAGFQQPVEVRGRRFQP